MLQQPPPRLRGLRGELGACLLPCQAPFSEKGGGRWVPSGSHHGTAEPRTPRGVLRPPAAGPRVRSPAGRQGGVRFKLLHIVCVTLVLCSSYIINLIKPF